MQEKVNENNEQEVLAKVRTLLALERNYLAEERTALAEFRTGLALMLIGPTVGTIIAFVLSVLSVEQSIILDVMNLAFFSILTVLGVWIIFRSQSKLKMIRKNERTIKKHIIQISKSSKDIYDLLFDYVKEDAKKKDKSSQ
ncbi:hypothetical protein AC477_00645 [miscellaneous Crenarchaeota group-1 archaeon SG8-32-1]|uniref:DUF202 domain-containing protein n=1 Tax=miscellaneous Crenarchaeota group-1 archaeon SG8-32-1 TaxID=1685124 RepID=A0A0M0C1K0_9ARCH|nr:MAG: hypothetical protein AC477_00645 [miscellaneous Crenarchaeota group-1 archaeon SG8-32-1]